MSSAIYTDFLVKGRSKQRIARTPYMIVFKKNTLHIGATRMAPSHALGCFRCIFNTTAPPMDCPNRKLGRERNSGFSAT